MIDNQNHACAEPFQFVRDQQSKANAIRR